MRRLSKKTIVSTSQQNVASFICAITIVVVTSLKICASERDCGETKSSVMHYALLEHAYKRSIVQEYPACIKSCMKDPSCKSCNYHLTTQQCELNNKTREMAPDKYVRKDYSIYTEMLNL
ncbi:hypothetical protein P5673_022623 [Acropora cervicornis]|uniref:Apple domain-containing protein n=1 Tax=Acropora cervicornis TaxID=6130 RepID=A0AAD9UZK7_ACRCE|nr:hypothetical protein P5673_022623 [Acropora cervicornis]